MDLGCGFGFDCSGGCGKFEVREKESKGKRRGYWIRYNHREKGNMANSVQGLN